MVNPFLGQINAVGFNFAPRGWATCSGQLLPISSNSALFSLLGTAFGGDGRTTFALPDLRGRSIVGMGDGPGLTPIAWGERGGAETHTLTTAQMPSHKHDVRLHGEQAVADTKTPSNNMLAFSAANTYAAPVATDDVAMASQSITENNVGGGQSFNIRNPFLGLYVCIALQGVFPSRS